MMASMPMEIASPERTRGDRFRVALLVLGVIVALSALVFGSGGVYIANKSVDQLKTYQHNAHKHTEAQNATIIRLVSDVKSAQTDHANTLGDIKTLSQTVASVIEGLPVADAEIVALAKGLEADLNDLCASTHTACAPLPALP